MEKINTTLLRSLLHQHCGMVDRGELLLKNCALVIVSDTGNLVINKNLPEKPAHMPTEEFIVRLMVVLFEGQENINYTFIPWNRHCEKLNTGFRQAWRFNFSVRVDVDIIDIVDYIVYDIPLCQEMWMTIIRAYRNRALKQLDIEFNMALEQNDSDGVEEIGLIKKMLRDLPTEINIQQYDTYEKIISFWPTILLPAPDFVAPHPPEIPVAG